MGPLGSKRYVTAVCYDIQLDNGGETGKPYAAVSLRVVDGPDAGRDFVKRLYLTAAARHIAFEQLRALGWTGTKISKAMAEGLGSRKATLRLEVKSSGKGKHFEDVTGIYEPKEPRSLVQNAIDDTDLDAFDALFEDEAAAIEAKTELTERNMAPTELPARVTTNGTATTPANPNDLGF